MPYAVGKPAPTPAPSPRPVPVRAGLAKPSPAPAPVVKPSPVVPRGPKKLVKPVPQPPEGTENIIIKNAPASSGNISAPDIVPALLFALIVVNFVTSGQYKQISDVITKKSTDTKTSHHAFLMVGGELVFLIGISLISSMGDTAKSTMLVFVIALWVVWGVGNASHIQNFMKKVQ